MPERFFAHPLFGVAVTVIAYALARLLYRRFRMAHTLLTTCGALVVLLLVARIPYKNYAVGGDLVAFFLGPATVALAVPLYKQAGRIRAHLAAVLVAIFLGAAAGLLSVMALVWALHGSRLLLLSMLPKSVTTPICIELARQLGGNEKLAALSTVLAGLLGSIIGPALLRIAGVRHDLAIGAAMGTSSHGIGTARLVQESQEQAGVSALSMALCGIFTSLLVIPLRGWV